MLLFFYATLFLLFLYGLLITYYGKAWSEIPVQKGGDAKKISGKTRASVIIAARNEEKNILPCLDSIIGQSYPSALVEIIVVDDHSTDGTAALIRKNYPYQVKLISLQEHLQGQTINSFKKKAIEVAIGASTGQLILTTDADCTMMPDWLAELVSFQERHAATFLAAPVKIADGGSLLSIFQSLDFISLQGITGASVYRNFHSMCNGANLAYRKDAFYTVDGFRGIDSIASGDDMLLMHKITNQFPGQTYFVKSPQVIVSTLPAESWAAFFRQRIRWASKADKYEDKRIFWVLLLVFLLNCCLFAWLLVAFTDLRFVLLLLLLIIIKTILEFSFVRKVAAFFSQTHLLKFFFFMQPLHVIYTVIAGFLGKFGSYQWKGRRVN